MRTGCILFLSGIFLLTRLPTLPPVSLSLTLPLFLILMYKNKFWRWPGWICCGFLWALLRADLMLSDNLEKRLEGELLLAEGRVVSLPVNRDSLIRFDFRADKLTDQDGTAYHKPLTLRLNWYRSYPEIRPGESWRLYVKLKRPYGFVNPGGFDYEGYLFRQGINATGYVVNREHNLQLSVAGHTYLHHQRFQIRQQVDRYLSDHPQRALVSGLVVGDRSAITPEQWLVLTRTGTSHLLAISGLHIGLVAALVFFITRRIWPLLGTISHKLAGPRVAAVTAVLAALGYAALAGFSIPTQRALIMLTIFMLFSACDRLARSTDIIALALIAILFIDPFAVISASFWLSFGAILVILYGMTSRINVGGLWWRWGRVQWLAAVGLIPLLIIWFQQIPLVGVLTNLIAVPWVSMLTIPILLAGILLACIHGGMGSFLLNLGADTLQLLWVFLEPVSRYTVATTSTPVPAVLSLCAAIVGVLLLLMPRGLPGRWLGIIWVLPALLPIHHPPAAELFRLVLLDVGQGLAAVVHTRNHILLYDTGPKYSDSFNAAEDVVLPYLNSQGIRVVNRLVASHGDSDHIGGLRQLAAGIEIKSVLSSDPESITYIAASACRAGHSWDWDGVHFKILYPQERELLSENNLSCVLQVTDGSHTLLLTGDIERPAEQRLVARYGGNLKADVLVAPHHGSTTSSSPAFIKAVQPQYVLFPVGYRNRFNFPKQDIIADYQAAGAIILDTAASGAVEVGFSAEGIMVTQYRQRLRRFWHTEF